jgi:hypothetical protein
MECEFNRTPYKEDWTNYLGHEHLTASIQQGKYSEDTFKTSSEEHEDAFRSTRTPALLGYEELGGLLDPGTWDCPRGTLLLGYEMGHDPRSTSIVTTRNTVELLVQ